MDIKHFVINDTDFFKKNDTFWPRNAKYGACYFDWLRIRLQGRGGEGCYASNARVRIDGRRTSHLSAAVIAR